MPEFEKQIELLKQAEVFNKEKAWLKVLDLLTDDILNQYNSAELHTERAIAHGGLDQRDVQLQYLEKAIAFNPNYFKVYYVRANYWTYSTKKTEEAIKDYTKAIELNPDYSVAYHNRGTAWANKNEYNEAIKDYTKAIELNPDFADAYCNRGSAWGYIKRYDEAIKDYAKSIELNSNNPLAYFNRSSVWVIKKEYDEAIKDLIKTIELNSQSPFAYYSRGLAWSYKKEYDKAIKDYAKAIELNLDNPHAYYNRGQAWLEKEEYHEAIKDFTKAIELNSDEALAYYNRGKAWLDKEKYDESIKDFTKAIELDPGNSLAYYNRGVAWAYKKKYDQAIKDFTKAIELNPDEAYFYFSLYITYNDLEKYSIALYYLNRSLFLKYHNISNLIKVYHQGFLLPFMLRKTLMKLRSASDINSFLGTYSENQNYCNTWEMYIDLLNYEYISNDVLNKLRIQALINYFMGDCIESFRIYDEDIENDSSFCLNLRDQYYYIKSAQEFLEPFESNLNYALKQAETDGDISVEDCYYAGQLFLLNGEITKSESYFLKASSTGFRPALYQLATLYDKQLYNPQKRNEICERIKQLENKNADRYSFINGISPLLITEKTDLIKDVYDFCKYYAYYAENLEEIQLVRHLLHLNYPYKRYEFWELLEFDEQSKINFTEKIAHHELLAFEQKIFKAFDNYCQGEGINKFIQRISNSNQALTAFEDIKRAIEDKDFKEVDLSYEKALAQKIKDMTREQVAAKWFLVYSKVFYLQGYLTIKEAVCLHLYAEELAIKYKDETLLKEINLEIETWVSKVITISSPLLTKLIFNAFKFVQDGFEIKKSDENDYKDYLLFKKEYYNHLEFWKSSLIKEFIAKETPNI